MSTGIEPLPRVERAKPWLICKSDCNVSPPPLRLRRLDRARQAQRLIQPCRRKSNRTITAAGGGVNRKMDKLTRD
jgi:hypothetical protein